MSHSTWYNGEGREFIETAQFMKGWVGLGLDSDDLIRLQSMLLENPRIGDVMPGTSGIRKVRFPIGNKGKRGGARVIYVDVTVYETMLLIDVYAKSSKEKPTHEQLKRIDELANQFKRRLSGYEK